jgi:hypothetical protein
MKTKHESLRLMISLANYRQIQRPSVKIIYKYKELRTHYSATFTNLNIPKTQAYQLPIHINYIFFLNLQQFLYKIPLQECKMYAIYVGGSTTNF